MQINKIQSIDFNIYPKTNNKKNYTTSVINNTNYSPAYYQPIFTGRVDKGMARFYEVNISRMPNTVKEFIASTSDAFSMSPLEVQAKAFEKLKEAKSIDDVKNLFKNETLFEDLESAIYTKATNGILGLYREYKELYENSPLSIGEDFTIYLLKKIFIESKTIDEINTDMETDLHVDLRDEFKRRHKDSQYILPSTLKSLGIKMPDLAYQNSLRFTREGYSDSFGLKISQGQLKYWNSLTDEQKFEILSKRLEGRDNWWNNLSYDEKLEYAAGIDSEEELYKKYKSYVSLQKRRKTYGGIGEEGSSLNNVQLTHKRLTVGSKLQHKDLFALWMKKNLEKFYEHLSEADKDTVHMKRVRRLALRWQTMTPEEKTDLINKMREGRKPLKFAMIDAWNHSHDIIKELSKFLKEKQILKPIDMLYDSEGFSEFQSAIMTEFWATHPEFAEQLGENIRKSQEKVQDSINRGQFQGLQQRILDDRAFRIKLIKRELYMEKEKQKELELQQQQSSIPVDYKKEFAELYKEKMYKDVPVPNAFINDMTNILLEKFSQEEIIRYTGALKNDTPIPFEIMNKLNEFALEEDPKTLRINRALEAAISTELIAKGMNMFDHMSDTLIMAFSNIIRNQDSKILKKKDKIDLKRIEEKYNEYKKDIPELELKGYVLNFFIPKTKENTDIEKLKDFVGTFGRSISILFSEQSSFSTEAKISFKNKLYTLMPSDLKDKYLFLLDTDEKVRNEKLIKQIDKELRIRFNFIDKKFMDYYLSELKHVCRYFEDAKEMDATIMYRPDAYLGFMGLARKKIRNEAVNIPVPRHAIAEIDKFEFLAMEQAMADELFEACHNETVYRLSFESLCDLFIQAEELRKYPKAERKLIINDAFNDIHNQILNIEKLPNPRTINKRYKEYSDGIDDLGKTMEKENRHVNMEDVILWLNPIVDSPARDDIVQKRVENYYIKELLE